MHLARRLVHEGASVTVIETDPKLVQEAAETMDARVLKGNSMSLSSWRAAEAESMESVSYTHLTLPTKRIV